MATQITVYRTADKVIQSAVINSGSYVWNNEATYYVDTFIQVDGKKRVLGLHPGVEALDFTGALPSDFITSIHGDYTDADPNNWIEPTPEKYKFDGTFTNIVTNI